MSIHQKQYKKEAGNVFNAERDNRGVGIPIDELIEMLGPISPQFFRSVYGRFR